MRSVDRDGIITTIAGGLSEPTADGLPATSVSLAGGPTGMAFDGAGGSFSSARNTAIVFGG